MNALAHFMNRSRWEGLVILLVACGYLWELTNIPSFFEMPGVPGPMAFPRLLGIIFGATGLWLLVQPSEWRRGKNATRGGDGERGAAATPRLWLRFVKDIRFYAMWACILGYLALWPFLGFPLATFLLLVLFFRLMDETRWPVILGLSVVSTLVIYVIFAKGLGVKLGLGLLAPLF